MIRVGIVGCGFIGTVHSLALRGLTAAGLVLDPRRRPLRRLLGDPVEVSARVATRFGHPGIDDTAVVTFAYEDGSTATLVSVWHQILSRGSRRRLEVFCERGFLWTDDDHLGPLHVETTAGSTAVTGEAPP